MAESPQNLYNKNMKYIIGLVVVAVVVGFVAMQALLGPSASNPGLTADGISDEVGLTNNGVETVSESSETFSGTDTLTTLIALGVPVECTVTQADSTGDTSAEGTLFISGEKVRGDFLQVTPGIDEPVLASMILTEEMLYAWSEIDSQQYGFKVDISDATETEQTNNQMPISTDELVQYECARWQSIDNSIFVPPGTVLFQDMNALFEGGMEYGTVYEEGEF